MITILTAAGQGPHLRHDGGQGSALKSERAGRAYYFCSVGCQRTFESLEQELKSMKTRVMIALTGVLVLAILRAVAYRLTPSRQSHGDFLRSRRLLLQLSCTIWFSTPHTSTKHASGSRFMGCAAAERTRQSKGFG